MQELADIELLREYAEQNSEAAFAALVTRYINLVYSAALRKTGNPAAAEEITQAVFIILAKKADGLRATTILSGWLYQTTRLTAANFLRTEIRRARRDQEAYMQSLSNQTEPEVWPQIVPLLEDAMGRLSEKDRNAVALRFFEGKSFQEIGVAFGASENAAKKRVAHALEKLRTFFAKRGVVLPSAILIAAISANSIHAAPTALTKSVTVVAISKGAAAGGSTVTLIKGTLKLMAWTKAKLTLLAVAGVLIAAGTTTVTVKQIEEHKSEELWRYENIDSDTVAGLPPEVKILPTKFLSSANFAQRQDKFVGIRQPVHSIIEAAYNWRQARVIFTTPEPSDRYDFITTLAQGSREALQQELKNKLGLAGHHETRDMDVLLLKMQNPKAPGLRPPVAPVGSGYCYMHNDGYNVEIKWANELISKMGDFLEGNSQMPIIDQTATTTRYSIDIKWEEDPTDPEHKALQKVLREQLGLELIPTNMPIEMLVVQKVK